MSAHTLSDKSFRVGCDISPGREVCKKPKNSSTLSGLLESFFSTPKQKESDPNPYTLSRTQ